ncbi:peptidylprolyl isomerase [Enterovibrio norvegicus FF-162]|uniref:DUF1481 domain-containing protein n=1 Tax=Enterovibrio norvegicus TaxID=188144 RepID=UPI000316ED20|nr:DUF1481 domain-containing protein [Enterovibrio norvegicus]OEE89337.1 peptidylprolyl isomerase [Enterovibrio norvegicus FF-162]
MRSAVTPLVSLLILSLAGCSSTESAKPPVQTQTAMIQGDATSIYWLDERLGFPETLSERILMGDYGQYSTEYRWRKGIVREIQRDGEVLIDGKLTQQSFLIRYDSEGQAVYQQNRLDGDMRPLRTTDLVRYYQQAEQALSQARELNKSGHQFFQGYWSKGILEECFTDEEKALSFNAAVPSFILQRLNQEDNFIAAMGKVGRKMNTVDAIIALDNDSADCIERPDL